MPIFGTNQCLLTSYVSYTLVAGFFSPENIISFTIQEYIVSPLPSWYQIKNTPGSQMIMRINKQKKQDRWISHLPNVKIIARKPSSSYQAPIFTHFIFAFTIITAVVIIHIVIWDAYDEWLITYETLLLSFWNFPAKKNTNISNISSTAHNTTTTKKLGMNTMNAYWDSGGSCFKGEGVW